MGYNPHIMFHITNNLSHSLKSVHQSFWPKKYSSIMILPKGPDKSHGSPNSSNRPATIAPVASHTLRHNAPALQRRHRFVPGLELHGTQYLPSKQTVETKHHTSFAQSLPYPFISSCPLNTNITFPWQIFG